MLKRKSIFAAVSFMLCFFTACTAQSSFPDSQASDTLESSSNIANNVYDADFLEYQKSTSYNRTGINFFSLREIPELTDENSGQAYIGHTENKLYINFTISVSINTGSPVGPKITYELDLATNTLANVVKEDYEGEVASGLSGQFPDISDLQLIEIATWFKDAIQKFDAQ